MPISLIIAIIIFFIVARGLIMQSRKEKKTFDKYSLIINEANKSFTRNEFQIALEKYRKAKLIKPFNYATLETDYQIGKCLYHLQMFDELLTYNHFENEEAMLYYKSISAVKLNDKRQALIFINRGIKVNHERFVELRNEIVNPETDLAFYWESIEKNCRQLLLKNIGINEKKHVISKLEFEHLTNTEHLDLSNRKELFSSQTTTVEEAELYFCDTSFLRHFAKLKYLNLCGQKQIKSISSLANCTSLIEVNLAYTSIKELKPFAKLNNLKIVNLHCMNVYEEFTPVIDLMPLKDLKIEKIDLTKNILSSFQPLNSITSLIELSLFNTNIKSLSEIRDLKKLKTLITSCSSSFSLKNGQAFPDLKYLYISKNEEAFIEQFKKINSKCEVKIDYSINIFKNNSILQSLIQPSIVENRLKEFQDLSLYFENLNQQNRMLHYPKVLLPMNFVELPTQFRGKKIAVPSFNLVKIQSKGASEDYFYRNLCNLFKSKISQNAALETHKGYLPKYPDILLYDHAQKIYIDIEIDEPYAFNVAKLTHCIDGDDDRNFDFLYNNWFVIRFTEEQVIRYPVECSNFIMCVYNHILNRLDNKNVFFVNNFPFKQAPWTVEDAKNMKSIDYRNSYLGKVKL